LKEASKLAHGGTGDVRTEWFEEIFGKSMEKYERVKGEMLDEVRKQDGLLEQIRVGPLLILAWLVVYRAPEGRRTPFPLRRFLHWAESEVKDENLMC
jgi:hypothetical protein